MNYNFDGTMVRNASIRSMLHSARDDTGMEEKKRPTIKLDFDTTELYGEDGYLVLFTLFALIIGLAMETGYSIFSLIDTKYNYVNNKCPNNFIWLYVALSTTILKFLLYVSFKVLNELDNHYDFVYYLFPDTIFSTLFTYWGYITINGACIQVINYTHLYKAATYHVYTQGIFSVLSSLYISYLIYKKCTTKQIENKKDAKSANKNETIDEIEIEIDIDKVDSEEKQENVKI